MPRNPRSAVITVRLAPQLKAGLQESAAAAGCSLNAFVVQVLAAAAGHQVRFRGTADSGPTAEEQVSEVRQLDRDFMGNPVLLRERSRHICARMDWIQMMYKANPERTDVGRLARRIDAECPWFYVEWSEFDGPQMPELAAA